MPDTWAARWAGQWAAGAQRFNQNHVPAGNPAGGEFTTSGGTGKGASAKGGKGKPAAKTSPAAKEDRTEAQLKAQAAADRAKAARLTIQLHALEKQAAAAHAASVHHAAAAKAAAAKAGHINPHAKHTPGKTHKAAAAHAKHHASLKTRIAGLKTQIAALLAQAKQLDARAAAM